MIIRSSLFFLPTHNKTYKYVADVLKFISSWVDVDGWQKRSPV